MDSRTGLDYIVENRDYVAKLGSALDTENHTVKKQVFELLSALCAYNSDGYNRALETLEHYTNLKSERYRLKLVVNELDNASAVDYQISLLAFINCVIISAPTLQKRIKIRNEFIGLNLLSVINNLRKASQNVPDIKIQLDVFDEQRESDEAQNLQDPDGINLNSHLDVFYAILRQVADTPQGIPFLSILQHLLRIDPKEPISDLIWDTAETLVHRATLLENRDDSHRLLRAPSVQKFTCPHCRADITGNRKQSLGGPLTPSLVPSSPPSFNLPVGAPAPPPPPPVPPPIPQQPSSIPPPPPPSLGQPPPPPPINRNQLHPANSSTARPKTPELVVPECTELLPQQETPMPKSKMKTINWNKIPSNKVMGKNNIWTMVASSQNSDKIKSTLDWAEIEGLFCQQMAPTAQGSPKLGRDKCDTLERKKKENSEINLLDGKRSLNVNIFLKQFRSSNEDIILLIKNGEHDDIGAEKLRGLLKILPEVDELDMLKNFDGDKTRLGNAEKFLLDLMKLSSYKLRIECMLLKEEFSVNMGYLEPAIRAMLYAGEDLMTNKALQEVLYMVLVTGNFLNSGGYAGNAAGVKLSSLQKLTDIRANKPGMNLIHFVALQTEKTNPELLKFPEQLTTLENASKTSVEQLNNELIALDSRIKKIKKNIESPQTDKDIKDQMMEFLQIAEREVSILQNYMKELDNLKVKLAEFFVEDVNTFKMEECYKILQNFREKFRLAVVENERRRYQEEQAAIRRRQREDQLAAKRRTLNLQLDSNSSMDSTYLLDPLQFPVSPALSRRRMGSFNNNDLASPKDPNASPEGSLRRRKSRNLNEDETLMDFLRSSGHDNFSRERKTSYGSLDRSWARRNRPEPIRKRPDLFNVDFNGDRERSHSPSPLVESKELPGEEPHKPRISKEWHQKIQNWLQHNDDGKKGGDFKKTRLSNRRSYEEDSESDRGKLDPLPEEPPKRKWQPSNALEGTDIVGTIEAIQEAQPKSKDHSQGWTDGNRIRRQLSKEKCPSPQLESIIEENRRKLVIQQLGKSDDKENMELYIRRPIEVIKDKSDSKLSTSKSDHTIVTSPNNTQNIYVKSVDSGPHSITNYGRSSQRRNRIDIDSDNIETPPVTRKSLSSLDKSGDGDNKLENDAEIGTGQFDRFSSARKTRRYKRPTNLSSNADDQSLSPVETLDKDKSATKIYLDAKSPQIVLDPPKFQTEDKESRLKRWQERLKSLDQSDGVNDIPTPTNTTSRSNSRKNISLINPEEVKEAVHYLQRNGKTTKINNNELNDEGFEESQSLVSDTPSQGKDNLSGTESSMEKIKPVRMNSSESAITTTSNESKSKSSTSSARPKSGTTPVSSALVKRSSSLKRTPSKPNLPTRKNSLRKDDSQSSITSQSKRNNAGSRNSLLSSRSSLNSAVSTNTVRRAPTKPTSSLFESAKKSTTTPLRSTLPNSSRIPASSPSQTTTQLRRPTTSSSSFTKDSVNNRLANATNYPLKPTIHQNSSTNSITSTKPIPSSTPSKANNASSVSLASLGAASTGSSKQSNFMRPTASSTTKTSTAVAPPAKVNRFR